MRHKKVYPTIEEPVINITPLIDVVFVVLIMFILIAPLVDKENVDLARGGEGDAREVKETSPIAVVVKKNSDILLNRVPLTIEELPLRLRQIKNSYPTAVPQLFHDKMAPFGTYQEVKLAMESAGFTEMELVLDPPTIDK